MSAEVAYFPLSQATACMTASSNLVHVGRELSAAHRLRKLLVPFGVVPRAEVRRIFFVITFCMCCQAVQGRPAGCMLGEQACTPPCKCTSLTPDTQTSLGKCNSRFLFPGRACSPLPEPGLGANTTAASRGASGDALNQTLQGHEQPVSLSGPAKTRGDWL